MSNGSENIAERCVHAPEGPDWAGLREPSSWKERALAAEAQNAKGGTIVQKAIDVALSTPFTLQQATEALTFTTDVWREYKAAVAERDALRAQLDSMTVEWGTSWGGETDDNYSWTEACGNEGDARGIVTEYPHQRLVQRLVSPWTDVEEATDGQQ